MIRCLLLVCGALAVFLPSCGGGSDGQPAELKGLTWDEGKWDEVTWKD